MKKNAYLWGNRREVGVIICLFLEWLDDNNSQIPCQQQNENNSQLFFLVDVRYTFCERKCARNVI